MPPSFSKTMKAAILHLFSSSPPLSPLLARQTFIISLTVPIPVRGFNFLHLLSIAFWNWIEHIKPRLSALKTPYFFQSPRFSFFSLISLLHIYSRKNHFPTLRTRLLTPRPDFCRLITAPPPPPASYNRPAPPLLYWLTITVDRPTLLKCQPTLRVSITIYQPLRS